MAKIIFWNMDRRPLPELAAALVTDHAVDLFLVAESDGTTATLDAINAVTAGAFREEAGPRMDRIRIFSRLPLGAITPVSDPDGARIVRVASQQGDVLLAAVHMRSMLFADDNDQFSRCVLMKNAVSEAERQVDLDSRTVLVGDFNANPFDLGLIGTLGLHAVMSRDVASGGGREVDTAYYTFFYNPMWSFLGDHPPGAPPGSYYYPGKHCSSIWHIMDQVLVRPALLDRFSTETVKVVHTAGTQSLLDERGRPARAWSSDHLPLVFELTI